MDKDASVICHIIMRKEIQASRYVLFVLNKFSQAASLFTITKPLGKGDVASNISENWRRKVLWNYVLFFFTVVEKIKWKLFFLIFPEKYAII